MPVSAASDAKTIAVCNHQDFGVDTMPFGAKLTHGYWPAGITKPTKDVPCVLVKNGPGTEMPLWKFGIKKLILRW